MAITTRIAPHYGWRMLIIGILSIVFSVWGAYDLWVKIPREDQQFTRYQELVEQIETLREKRSKLPEGVAPPPDDVAAYAQAEKELNQISPDGSQPTKPGKFDRLTQWFFISFIFAAPYFFILYGRANRMAFRLEEDGTLHFSGDSKVGSGTWSQDEISDIDMNRWMAKSIAHLVHQDGTRLKLDAYIHKHLDAIIGKIACRIYPEKWDCEARPIRPPVTESESDEQHPERN